MEPDELGPEDFAGTIPPSDQPAWCRQFAGFVLLLRLVNRNGFVIKCKFCDLALYVPLAQRDRLNPTATLNLARHGLEHATDGFLDHYAIEGASH